MKNRWICFASLTGILWLTGCNTAVNQSGQEKLELIVPTFTLATKPQIFVTDLQQGKQMNEDSSEFFESKWYVTMPIST